VTHAKNTALLSTLVLLVAACSTPSVAPPPPAPAPAPMAAPAPAPAPTPVIPDATPRQAPASSVVTVDLPDYLNPRSLIATERSVYFDFDNYAVKSDFAGLIERHGKFLASNPGVAIKIEGNADERGGVEYNLSLGQKRAEAVLKALKIYGAQDKQMEAISWGEGKPKSLGHDEAAWAQNRRADLQYPSK
jgi:peptidoglycan-associated lipoprotein